MLIVLRFLINAFSAAPLLLRSFWRMLHTLNVKSLVTHPILNITAVFVFDYPKSIDDGTIFVIGHLLEIQVCTIVGLHARIAVVLRMRKTIKCKQIQIHTLHT